MQQVNPSFKIQDTQINYDAAQLFVEAGPAGILFTIMEGENNFKAVVVYAFKNGLADTALAETMQSVFTSESLLQKQYHKTHIFWTFPESILVPVELMNADRNLNMLKLVYGDVTEGAVRSDFLYKHNLHNVYRTPQYAIDIFSTYLPVATQTHLFSTLVNKDLPQGNHLFTVFYSNGIIIMLVKEGKLQVVQFFEFSSTDDCVFHLLNVCKGFEVQVNTVTLHVNGLIDTASNLYESIYKYFLTIEFDELPGVCTYPGGVSEHPPHYFNHLFSLAACV